jgi:hypothetical protein
MMMVLYRPGGGEDLYNEDPASWVTSLTLANKVLATTAVEIGLMRAHVDIRPCEMIYFIK